MPGPQRLLILAIGLGAIGLWAAFSYWNRPHAEIRILSASSLKIGEPAPAFAAYDLLGQTVRLDDNRRIKLVNFWASWCNPCLQELPSMIAVMQNEGSRFELIAISQDTSRQDVDMILKAHPYLRGRGVRIVMDDGSLKRAFGVNGIPETFIVDADGRLRDRIYGAVDWRSPEILERLKKVK